MGTGDGFSHDDNNEEQTEQWHSHGDWCAGACLWRWIWFPFLDLVGYSSQGGCHARRIVNCDEHSR